MSSLEPAPVYTLEDLVTSSQDARRRFLERRLATWSDDYLGVYALCLEAVATLFTKSNSLTTLDPDIFVEAPALVMPARYLAGPSLSADDLDLLIESKHRVKGLSPQAAERISSTIARTLDPLRFPWLADGRLPTEAESEMAVGWTAGLWAVEAVRTRRRTAESTEQQARVADALETAGYAKVIRPKGGINAIDGLAKGTFAPETKIVSAKCDVPVRMHDGRLLAIECKVSGTDVNSVKRLLRETGGKADSWRTSLGSDQVIPVAVLAGSFNPLNLMEAQARHNIFLVWDHDLGPLISFLD